MSARLDAARGSARHGIAGLAATVEGARERYTLANPESLRAFETAKRALPGGNTRSVLFYSPFPVALARAEGALIEDIDGHSYQDFLGEYTAGLYGHSHPVLIEAISHALQHGLTLGGPTELEARYAQLLCERFPAIDQLRFCNSGTEANVLALSSARAFTGRSEIVVIDGSYHGGVLSYSGNSPLNLPIPVHRIRFNDSHGARETIRSLDRSLAGVIVEPMIGAGGCIPSDPEFLHTLREETQRTGALLIFDEVMTSRHGPSGLHGMLGIDPDLVTLGKYLGGGLSFGAFGGRAEILARFDPTDPNPWPHAGTFNNNVLSMSAGYAGLSEVYTPEVADDFFASGEAFRATLTENLGRLNLPIHLTGLGSMVAIHFTAETPMAPYTPTLGQQQIQEIIHLEMMNRGQFYARRGMLNLSLPISQTMQETFATALSGVMDHYRSHIYEAIGE